MTSNQRREKLKQLLNNASAPLSASFLADKLSVSRQIIVGDVALLRAANVPVLATPRGYIMQTETSGNIYTIACNHSKADLLQELYAIVDCGCGILDVTVEHAVYGQISGQLQIFSRFDADVFWQKLNENEALPLSTLTGNSHLHTITCPSEKHYTNLINTLKCKKFLAEDEE